MNTAALVWVFAVLVNTPEGTGWIYNQSYTPAPTLQQCLQILPAAIPLITASIVEHYDVDVLKIECLTPGQVQEKNDTLESI